MPHMRRTSALALILPLLLWGSPPASSQSRQEKKIIIEPGAARQGWLGIQIRDLTSQQAKDLEVSSEEGALVTDVTTDSPADKGGIKENDIVVEFNGRTIHDSEDLMKAVRRTKPGTAAAVVVERKAGKKNLQVTVGKLKRESWTLAPGAPFPPATPRMRFFHASMTCGMQLSDLSEQLGEYFGAPEGKGVLVEEVEKQSEGAKAGFKAGDVILRIGDQKVEELGDVTDALRDFKDGDTASVEILRKGSRQKLTLIVDEEEISSLGGLSRKGAQELREALGKIRREFGPEWREKMENLRHEMESIGRDVRHYYHQLGRTYAGRSRAI